MVDLNKSELDILLKKYSELVELCKDKSCSIRIIKTKDIEEFIRTMLPDDLKGFWFMAYFGKYCKEDELFMAFPFKRMRTTKSGYTTTLVRPKPEYDHKVERVLVFITPVRDNKKFKISSNGDMHVPLSLEKTILKMYPSSGGMPKVLEYNHDNVMVCYVK